MIIPALDFINGCIVRLYQGNYDKQNFYFKDPYCLFNNYLKNDVKFLHLVDLDGSKNPLHRQVDFLSNLISKFKTISVQFGGGIRVIEDVNFLLKVGVKRVVISSVAIKNIEMVKEWFKIFGPDKLVLALDIVNYDQGNLNIATNGWQEISNLSLEEVINLYQAVGLKHVLCTDISRDGTLKGSNIALYSFLCSLWPEICFQSSGGVNNLSDIAQLKNCGVSDVIIGRAFLENKFTLGEAIKCWQNA